MLCVLVSCPIKRCSTAILDVFRKTVHVLHSALESTGHLGPTSVIPATPPVLQMGAFFKFCLLAWRKPWCTSWSLQSGIKTGDRQVAKSEGNEKDGSNQLVLPLEMGQPKAGTGVQCWESEGLDGGERPPVHQKPLASGFGKSLLQWPAKVRTPARRLCSLQICCLLFANSLRSWWCYVTGECAMPP